MTDFTKTANTFLRPLGPAIAAILSKDPDGMALYEDLVSNDPTFWPSFWSNLEAA